MNVHAYVKQSMILEFSYLGGEDMRGNCIGLRRVHGSKMLLLCKRLVLLLSRLGSICLSILTFGI